jgi:hypothetical protein
MNDGEFADRRTLGDTLDPDVDSRIRELSQWPQNHSADRPQDSSTDVCTFRS